MKKPMFLLLLMLLTPGLQAADIEPADMADRTDLMENPISADDYDTRTLGSEMVDGQLSQVMEAVANESAAAKGLRYGRIKVWVDVNLQTIRKATFWDANDRPLLTIHVREFKHSGHDIIAHRVEITNHTSGEQIVFLQNEAGSPDADSMQDAHSVHF